MMESSKLIGYIGKKRKVLVDKLLNNDERVKLAKHACGQSNCDNVDNVDVSQFKPNQFQGVK